MKVVHTYIEVVVFRVLVVRVVGLGSCVTGLAGWSSSRSCARVCWGRPSSCGTGRGALSSLHCLLCIVFSALASSQTLPFSSSNLYESIPGNVPCTFLGLPNT